MPRSDHRSDHRARSISDTTPALVDKQRAAPTSHGYRRRRLGWHGNRRWLDGHDHGTLRRCERGERQRAERPRSACVAGERSSACVAGERSSACVAGERS